MQGFKDIKGYEGKYAINRLGQIWAYPTRNRRNGIILKPKIGKHGYEYTNLWKNKISKGKRVHRLVAETFIGNHENKPFINHINSVKTDNRVENLEWCTQSENVLHAFKNNGRIPNGMRKIIQLDLKGNTIKIHDSLSSAAREVGGYQTNISKCARGERKKVAGYKWRFLSEISADPRYCQN